MPQRKLQNYLRTHRKKSGLSQKEIAFLLGTTSGAKVSRYESLARQPLLHTVFAYELIFGVPARELFAGVFEEAERETMKRIQALVLRLKEVTPHRRTERRIEFLESIHLKSKNKAASNS